LKNKKEDRGKKLVCFWVCENPKIRGGDEMLLLSRKRGDADADAVIMLKEWESISQGVDFSWFFEDGLFTNPGDFDIDFTN